MPNPNELERKAQELLVDSGDKYLSVLDQIAQEDAAGLKKAQQSYGNSWKSRGGVGAFMMLARKWDRLENILKRSPKPATHEFTHPNGTVMVAETFGDRYDIFHHIIADQRSEGVIDDIRDLRRYLMLVEAEMRARGFGATHRDNAVEGSTVHVGN